jgi:hypothetical protein
MHSEIEKLRLEKIKKDVGSQIRHQTVVDLQSQQLTKTAQVIFSSTANGFSASKETSSNASQGKKSPNE